MYVLVDDRQKGKTTKLVTWLLDGEKRENYPGWSRIIVCPNSERVVYVTGLIKVRTQAEWVSLRGQTTSPRFRTLTDIRKAVWSLDDLRYNSFGGRMEVFEYALDDADLLLRQFLRVHKGPEVVTMTGQVWT